MFTIGRYIGDTTLNGVEHLLTEDGDLHLFDTEQDAVDFLVENMHITEEQARECYLIDEYIPTPAEQDAEHSADADAIAYGRDS